MLAEAEIESRIIDALKALKIEGLQVFGLWGAANRGEVKGVEDPASDVLCAVNVGVREYESCMSPWATINCSISISQRIEFDASGIKLLEVCEKIIKRFQTWQMDYAAVCDTFMIDEKFDVAGFNLAGGMAPQFDEDSGAWTMSQAFQLKGCFL